MQPVGAEEVAAPEQVGIPEDGDWSGTGSGWSAYGDVLSRRLGVRLTSVSADALCESRDIAVLAAAELAAGRSVSAERALPVYLRDRVTTVRPGCRVGNDA
jgi:tRNA threonylcarbamoyladenosine biosynthesis protein TsaB